jgi:5'-AMP-activated protein kinase catalytic alpha subunit
LITHKHVVQLFEVIETTDKFYLVMEYLENGDLSKYVKKAGRIGEKQACRFFH